MITITIALMGLGISIAGMGTLLWRHRNAAITEHAPASAGLFFEEFFTMIRTRGVLFWQMNLRDYVLRGSEKTLALCEDVFKRSAAFLRLLRSRIRRRQINGVIQEDRYWHNLNSWNARRLKIRLSRRKQKDEQPNMPA